MNLRLCCRPEGARPCGRGRRYTSPSVHGVGERQVWRTACLGLWIVKQPNTAVPPVARDGAGLMATSHS